LAEGSHLTTEDSAIETAAPDNSQPPTRRPPYPVILIALFQFFKSEFLLYLFLQFWHGYSTWAAAGRPYQSDFLQSFLGRPFIIVFPVASIAFIVIGWGLLRLKAWARGFLIGAILCTWIGGKFGSHLSLNALFFSKDVDLGHLGLPTILFVFLIDLFVFCSLVFYPDIAKTFGEKEDQDILS
jgi:hypothetical protein